MITCRELQTLLCELLAEELPPDLRSVAEQHLRDCPPCLAYFDSYRITVQLARGLPCPPPPPDVLQRLRAAVAMRMQPPPPPPPSGAYRQPPASG